MKPLLLITCLIILAGCNIDKILHSPKHDTKKLGKIHGRNPNVVNKGCLMWYPFTPIDSTSTVVVKSGNDTSDWMDWSPTDGQTNLTTLDSLGYLLNTDTIEWHHFSVSPKPIFKVRYITTHDTIFTTRNIVVSDTRLIAHEKVKADSLGAAVVTLDKSVSRAKTQRNLFMWLFFGSLVAGGALLYFKPKMLFK